MAGGGAAALPLVRPLDVWLADQDLKSAVEHHEQKVGCYLQYTTRAVAQHTPQYSACALRAPAHRCTARGGGSWRGFPSPRLELCLEI